ncbi:MAG: hypothetical protein RXO71_02020, partial [Nitrososphaeria archaeon]
VGYILYIVVGVLGNAAIGLVYQHFETVEGKVVSGITNALAWLQLILFNFGVMAATWSLMIAGYFGEADLLPPAVGGKGMAAGQVHVLFLSNKIYRSCRSFCNNHSSRSYHRGYCVFEHIFKRLILFF